MLLKVLISPLRFLNQEIDEEDIRKSSALKGSIAVGLRILTENSNPKQRNANIVINSGLKLSKPIFQTKQTSKSPNTVDNCFLKYCLLCNKTLSLDKEVYMYRGDQGFCSIVCRDKQIHLDEMREIEISTKKTLASIRRCRDSNWRETSGLLENHRRQRHRPQAMSYDSYQKNRAIFI